ncbi:hypothetical protein PPTG_16306 [Phytophthora nicotianae INRA-310]|uniref:Uncharacterized protein n=1 Tax=Phytophthora nicotianae (strain INRA-310) TaxID=761204 RepID=W2PRN2_PHYN3|nr:hypothetical protein PPTG_16306 [Phytophthora nicotianae INRA-310]ETN03271.1 hypothetical protein PPTG_16306 [Phytophthora nicotianae INRA-310]
MAISDNSSSNNAAQQEFTKLQEMMQNGANEATNYLDSLKSKFTDYDNSHTSSKEKASSYFESAMDRARKSVDDFKQKSEEVRRQGNNASDSAVDAAKRSMEQANSSLDDLGNSARDYDQRARSNISSGVDTAKDKGSSALSSMQDSISSLVNSTRDSTFHGFESLQNQFAATKKAMGERASSAADTVSNKASDASSKMNPDEPSLIDRATGAVSSGVNYVTSAFQGDNKK